MGRERALWDGGGKGGPRDKGSSRTSGEDQPERERERGETETEERERGEERQRERREREERREKRGERESQREREGKRAQGRGEREKGGAASLGAQAAVFRARSCTGGYVPGAVEVSHGALK